MFLLQKNLLQYATKFTTYPPKNPRVGRFFKKPGFFPNPDKSIKKNESPIDTQLINLNSLHIQFCSSYELEAQWKDFIQKGGQNFFLFRFLLFGVKIMFSMILRDPSHFLLKFAQVSL
jgi:hypothetical protein